MSGLLQIVTALGGAGVVGAGLKAGAAWIARQARREGKTDQLLEQLVGDVTDLKQITGQLSTLLSEQQAQIAALQAVPK